jgi:hypothetical protein
MLLLPTLGTICANARAFRAYEIAADITATILNGKFKI